MSLVPPAWPRVLAAASCAITGVFLWTGCPVLVALPPGSHSGLDPGRVRKAPFKSRNVAGYLFTSELSECCAREIAGYRLAKIRHCNVLRNNL